MADLASRVEVHSIDYISDVERHGRLWHQVTFWFVGNFHPVTVAIGFIGPELGLSFWWTVIASTVGVLFGTVFMAAHASQGPKLGLPQMIQSRAQFGYLGAMVTLSIALMTYVLFSVVNILVIENGTEGLYGLPRTAVGLLTIALAVLLAVIGYGWLHRVFWFVFWISLPFWILMTVGILTGSVEAAGSQRHSFSEAAFVVQFSVAASYNIAYAPMVSDYSRYLPRNTSTPRIILAVFAGAAVSAIWLMALGAWLASEMGIGDPLLVVHDVGNDILHGLGSALMAVSVVALVVTTAICLYSAQLILITGLDAIHKVRPRRGLRVITILSLALICGILGIQVFQRTTPALEECLLILLYLLCPWTAINLADYFFVRHGDYVIAEFFNPSGIYGRWKWRGIAAYLVGVLAMVPFVSIGEHQGPVARILDGVDVAFAVGLIVPAIFYLVASHSRISLGREEETAVRGD
jgi:nucleobase:cation symporter-1, NCS1 family